jgi:hypothetical protein
VLFMHVRFVRNALIASAAVIGLGVALPVSSSAQVSFGVNIGAQPMCPYGYYAEPPYQCAPYGYYGPTWFNSGVFIGAGPWFHGPRGFVGPVNHHYDPHYGYHGPYPGRGEHFQSRPDNFHDFHGNAFHDEHGGEAHGPGGHGGEHGGHH